MSATRVTLFICDECGKEELSPSNFSLPPAFVYVEANYPEPSKHLCESCQTVNQNEK